MPTFFMMHSFLEETGDVLDDDVDASLSETVLHCELRNHYPR